MDKIKDEILNEADNIKKYYSPLILLFSVILLIGSFINGFLYQIPALILCVVSVLLFVFCKNGGNGPNKNFIICTVMTVAINFATMSSWLVASLGLLSKPLFIISTLFCIATGVIMCSKRGLENTIDNMLRGVAPEEKIKPGDMVLGTAIEKDEYRNKTFTDEKVVIPLKDRFVHSLVLGPTGSGKTSQILLPTAQKDIKDGKVGLIVLEPKGDFAEQVYALAVKENRDVIYFNPALKNCPYFNPLRGNENDVIENIVTTFAAFDSDSSSFFRTNNENLLRRAVKVLKRLYGNDATLLQLETLVTNTGGEGINMVKKFDKLPCANEAMVQEHKAIYSWFIDDYFTGISGQRGSTKTFEQSSGVRSQISKLVSNQYLRKILNPKRQSELEPDEYIDFDKILREGSVLAMTSAQGVLRDLSRYLGYFLILNLQSAVFRRPGNENTRQPVTLIIDEFQTYANSQFADMLTQGRSYRVASILATQNRALIGMNSGNKAKAFTDLVSTNCRNVIVFPGANVEDATYYSKQFGDILRVKEGVSYSNKRFFAAPFDDRKTVKVDEKYEKRFTENDIIYQEFGEVICATIKKNTVQVPRYVKIKFIDSDLKEYVDNFLEDFKMRNEIQMGGADDNGGLITEKINNSQPDDNFDEIDLSIDLSEDNFNKTKDDIKSTNVDDNTFMDLSGAEEDDF